MVSFEILKEYKALFHVNAGLIKNTKEFKVAPFTMIFLCQ
jgi:hypothetical protein